MKVKYLGHGPGQAAEIIIGGFRFSRGETYDIPADEVKRLGLDREGFEVASGSKKKASKEIE
jgi:hypothetical protein